MVFLKNRLKDILLDHQLISPADFERALREQEKNGGELSQILIDQKMIDEDTLAQVLSESLGIPPINISRMKVDDAVLQIIPQKVAQKYKIMPISLIGDSLTLAMADPLNIFVIDNIKFLTGYTINPIIARRQEIQNAIHKYYGATEPEGSAGASAEAETENLDGLTEILDSMQGGAEELDIVHVDDGQTGTGDDLTDEAPIIKLTDTIVRQSVLAKASDVFIEPMDSEVRIRYRVDGVIREMDRMPKALLPPIVSRIKVISNLDISEHRLPQDGRFKMILGNNREVDFRVNVLPTALGEKVCLRVLDQGGTVLDVDNLGFEPLSLKRLKECALKPHGMILTCGPTGSGKTTTLYSILHHVDSPGLNIVTVEDPVEYQFPNANQVNVKPAMGLTFPLSLRSILRQDPDIIMIGEIRDSETLDIAVKAALTGHLVLSSLHTTTAAGSVIRMVNMGVEPFLVCSSVLAIIAQRLLRRVCPACSENITLSDAVLEKLGFCQITDAKGIVLKQGKGCPKCFNTGYKGRVGITELLALTPEVKDLIFKMAGESKIKMKAREQGMITMREDALLKAMRGLTTVEEVLRVTAPDEPLERSTKEKLEIFGDVEQWRLQ